MLKNLILYRLGPEWPTSADQLVEALAGEPFAPCAATQRKSTGWVPPREEHGALVESVAGHWIARMLIETKSVPASEVKKRADAAADEIERTQGRKPGKKEMRDLKDDALIALLPQAFPRRKAIAVWIDPQTRILAVDATSQGAADEVITSLVRVAGKGFALGLLQTNTSPMAAMTAWLSDPKGDALPDAFNIERECELKGSGDEPARVRFDHHSLDSDEIPRHIQEGKLPTRLALDWQGRVRFTLTQALQLKKIAFLRVVLDGERDQDDDRFDADVALTTGDLAPLIAELIDALGGDAAPTPMTEIAPDLFAQDAPETKVAKAAAERIDAMARENGATVTLLAKDGEAIGVLGDTDQRAFNNAYLWGKPQP